MSKLFEALDEKLISNSDILTKVSLVFYSCTIVLALVPALSSEPKLLPLIGLTLPYGAVITLLLREDLSLRAKYVLSLLFFSVGLLMTLVCMCSLLGYLSATFATAYVGVFSTVTLPFTVEWDSLLK
jgi:hypothetical protein